MAVSTKIPHIYDSSIDVLLKHIGKLQTEMLSLRMENAELQIQVKLLKNFTKFSVKRYLGRELCDI